MLENKRKIEFGSVFGKICPWDGGVCSSVSCASLVGMGDVYVCPRHRNPAGFHLSRFHLSRVNGGDCFG